MKLLLTLLVLLTLATAQDTKMAAPSADATKAFIEYFNTGSDAVLFDAKLTSKVVDSMPTDEVSEVAVGSVVSIWVKFMMPKNSTDNSYKAVFKKGDTTLKTKTFELSGGEWGNMGYRSWSSKGLHSAGAYTVEIVKGDAVVKSFNVTVK